MPVSDWKLQIAVSDLRDVTNILLNHLEDVVGSSVDTSRDYYWEIPSDQRYNMTEKPSELTIGQLADDWQELRKLLGQEKEDVISYGLVWLGSIFKAIGEDIVA